MNNLSTVAPEAEDETVPVSDATFWNELIDESAAAAFIDLARGTVANYRQSGDGPPFIRISARCIRYRRLDLKAWADERLVTSTSDPGPKAADPLPAVKGSESVP